MSRVSVMALICLCVAGCNMASAHFADVPAKRVAVDNVVFDVRVKGALAEANRVSQQLLPRFEQVAPSAARAIRIASGCDVVEVRGDAAQIVGVLACKAVPTTQVSTGTELYDCAVIDRATDSPDVVLTVDYDCNGLPF